MHSWIDGKKIVDPESLYVINFISKHSYSFGKSRFELNTTNHLPVVKKGKQSVEGDMEVPSKLLKNLILKRYYIKEDNSGFSIQTLGNFTKGECTKIFTSLPPLVNVNCLLNTEIKQKQAIWNTNFGRKLINRKTIIEKPISKVAAQLKPLKKKCEKVAKPREFKPKKKLKMIQKNAEVVSNFSLKSKEKESKDTIKKSQDSLKVKTSSIKHVQKTNSNSQNSVIRTPLSQPFYENLSTPSFCKNQKFLAECVERILNNDPESVACDHCSETFLDIEGLYEHKKQLTTKKEICLLCEKTFYNPNDFTQHLLTHESVDSFSCKKCKKYFPSLKKFNQHCKEYHIASSQYSFRRVEL